MNNGFELISTINNKTFPLHANSLTTGEEGKEESILSNINVSIPIASAITGYSRIEMSYYKSLENINIYYSDTDSIHTDKPLPNYLIGKDIGKMKLEHIFDDAVYLAPKVYGGIVYPSKITRGYEYVKVKGFKNPITFNELKTLINKNATLDLNQDKWFKNITDGSITICNQIYTLVATENKRKLIYDKNNKLIDTEPFILVDGIIEK